jgi:hypothetical protein
MGGQPTEVRVLAPITGLSRTGRFDYQPGRLEGNRKHDRCHELQPSHGTATVKFKVAVTDLINLTSVPELQQRVTLWYVFRTPVLRSCDCDLVNVPPEAARPASQCEAETGYLRQLAFMRMFSLLKLRKWEHSLVFSLQSSIDLASTAQQCCTWPQGPYSCENAQVTAK